MGLTRPRFWLVCLMYLLLTVGVESLFHLFPSDQEPTLESFRFFIFFCTILYNLYFLVIRFGFHLWSLWTWRRLNPGMGALIQGFSITGRVLVMELLIFLRVLVWIFLLVFAFTLVILMIPVPAILFLGIILLYAAVFAITLQYAAAPYLLADYPDDGASAAVQRSVELMRGRKWALFKLQLSFFGWYLLQFVLSGVVLLFFLVRSGVFDSAVTMDALWVYQSVANSTPVFFLSNLITLPLLLWLLPYASVTQAGFYDDLCRFGSSVAYDEMPPL